MEKVVVLGSPIQGKGVCAAIYIKKGDLVLDINDSHVVRDPAILTDEQNEYDCDYLADGTVILMQEPEKYITETFLNFL